MQVVLAGAADAIADAGAVLTARGVRTQPLGAGVAFHSPWVAPIVDALAADAPAPAARPHTAGGFRP